MASTGRLEAYLPYQLAVISHLMTVETAKQYRGEFGLRVHEWRVLTTIGHMPGLSATEICAVTLIHRAKVSRILADLEYRGLVMKNIDRNDKRTLHLRLSRKGRAIFEEVIGRLEAWERQFLECFTPFEQAHLERLLANMQKALRQMSSMTEEAMGSEFDGP